MSLLEETLRAIEPQDASWRAKARERLEQLTMPHWALGRLMDLAEDLAGMTRSMEPPVSARTVVVMAGDHGVVAEGVSRYPQEVTPQMVANFVVGGAGINTLARQAGAQVAVVDMGVAAGLGALAAEGKILSRRIGPGTGNIARGPAMTREEAVRCLEAGIEIASGLAESTDLFGAGDMGIGNTTPSAAIIAAIRSLPPSSSTAPIRPTAWTSSPRSAASRSAGSRDSCSARPRGAGPSSWTGSSRRPARSSRTRSRPRRPTT